MPYVRNHRSREGDGTSDQIVPQPGKAVTVITSTGGGYGPTS
jgi:N-methylhydantoinase B/oxoprolinase/acetone carboxylase alpha subunit